MKRPRSEERAQKTENDDGRGQSPTGDGSSECRHLHLRNLAVEGLTGILNRAIEGFPGLADHVLGGGGGGGLGGHAERERLGYPMSAANSRLRWATLS
jgi:hypothetical protein